MVVGGNISSERILVIDDEPQILSIIGRFLQKLGYKVEKADSGMAALQRLGTTPFALVLSDLKMPHMDGLQILQKVKEEYPDTVFVIMTAFATIDSTISALREGVYDFLTKPLDLSQLASTVQRALEHRALTLQNRQLMEFLQEKNRVLKSLHREEQRKSEQLRRINAIAHQITPILDMDELIDTVVDKTCQVFHFSSLSFGLIDQDRIVFKGASPGAETPPKGWSEEVKQSAFWQLTKEGREPFVRFLLSADDQRSHYDLIFPLRAGKQTVGFWVANWHKERPFRQEDLSYLESLAAQTVVVLENARLYALAKRADELAFLNLVGKAANQSLDLQETMQSVLTCMQSFGTPYQAGTSLAEITLFGESELANQRTSKSASQRTRVRQMFRLANGTFQQDTVPVLGYKFVAQVGVSPLIVRGQAQVEQMCGERVRLQSLLGVSLYFGERQIGVLGIGSVDQDAYSIEDGRLLQIAGQQIATAIENARLFQEVESKQRQVLESRNTLLSVFNSILDGITIIDRDRKILAINRTQAACARHDFGHPQSQELAGKPAELAFPVGLSQRLLACIEETFQSGKLMAYTDREQTDDADRSHPRAVREWNIRTYPVVGSEGEVDRVVVVARDVTEQRQLEASLIQSEKMASVGQLAAGIAHEINNPLTVISANVQILREELSHSHPYYQSVELIHRAEERASKIVRDLLNISRPERFEFVPTDLNLSLQDTISLIANQIRRANIHLVSELAPDLPLIQASPDHLRIVWLNLLLNARDALRARSPEENDREGWIKVTSGHSKDAVTVRISDNGIGISPDVLKRIYDPFFTTKAPDKGTGLGLFTCYRTVSRHNGQIHVDSQVGRGTTFEIRLPIHRESD